MPMFSYLSDTSAMIEVLGRYPEKYRSLCEFTEIVMRSPSDLSKGERELIFAYTSGLNACDFCFGTHAATAEQFDVDTPLFESLIDDIDASGVEESLKPILKLVRKLTISPSRVTEADAKAVFEKGWSEEAFENAINVCGVANFYNRLIEGHRGAGLGHRRAFEGGRWWAHRSSRSPSHVTGRIRGAPNFRRWDQ